MPVHDNMVLWYTNCRVVRADVALWVYHYYSAVAVKFYDLHEAYRMSDYTIIIIIQTS